MELAATLWDHRLTLEEGELKSPGMPQAAGQSRQELSLGFRHLGSDPGLPAFLLRDVGYA